MMIPAMRAFDTHKYIKELTKSGFKEGQAEIIIKSILESRDYDFSKLSTKEQVAAVEKEIGFIREEISKFATKEQLVSIEKDIELVRKEIGFVRQELDKFTTKDQLTAMEERFIGRLSASENTMLKWIIPPLFTTMAAIAFKLFYR